MTAHNQYSLPLMAMTSGFLWLIISRGVPIGLVKSRLGFYLPMPVSVIMLDHLRVDLAMAQPLGLQLPRHFISFVSHLVKTRFARVAFSESS